jgi:tetratricopeptide (TPR) repeat protein
MRRLLSRVPLLLIAAALPIVMTTCAGTGDYYRSLSSEREARELFDIVDAETDPQVRVTALRRLARYILSGGGPHALSAYLTTFVDQHPDDPYGGYLLFLAAQTYLEHEARSIATYYLDRVVSCYGDVVVDGGSIREAALTHLVRLAPSTERRVDCYRMLIDEYADTEDVGLLYYRLGESLEELGEWDAANDAYRHFLQYPETVVPDQPTAHRIIRDRIAFYDAPSRNWVVPTLDELYRRIAYALRTKDVNGLLRYQSQIGFFTRSWEQDFDDPNATPNWQLGEVLARSQRIAVDAAPELDADGDEAYLWTYGWGELRIRDWYFYFRRVHMPSDPEINGSWEWAGVFLGQRL